MSYFQFCEFFFSRLKKKYNFFTKFTFYNVTENFLKPFFKKNAFIKYMQAYWPVRFSLKESFWTKSVWPFRKKINGLFLRKTKSFYKGRYARNRQTCRVIVFWTIALNLLFIYGLYFFFYQFSFNFGYFWWGLFFLYIGLVWSTIFKHKLINWFNIFREVCLFFKWVFCFLSGYFVF